jgi:hypothetical protein
MLRRNKHEVRLKNWSMAKRILEVSLARPGDTLQARCMVRDELGDGTEALSEAFTRPSE